MTLLTKEEIKLHQHPKYVTFVKKNVTKAS